MYFDHVQQTEILNRMSNFQINILIVEDNLSFGLELQMLLEELKYNVIGRVDNSGEALDTIYSKNPDLVLMDIDIKGNLTGLEVGQKIKHLEIPVLFITSLNDNAHYEQAQQSNMIGYLVKPIDKITLRATLELAIAKAHVSKAPDSNLEGKDSDKNELENFVSKEALFFKKRGSYFKVKINQIAYVKSDDNYCLTTTLDGEIFVTRLTISKMEELLPIKKFMRTHRQYLVNTEHIDSIDFQDSTLKIQQKEIPVSRAKRKELASLIRKMD